jgi:hypothetical protein
VRTPGAHCPTRGLVRHLVDLAKPDRAAARGQPSTHRDHARSALPPGRRVVALGEVDEMPHPNYLGDQPPGEGLKLLCIRLGNRLVTHGIRRKATGVLGFIIRHRCAETSFADNSASKKSCNQCNQPTTAHNSGSLRWCAKICIVLRE